MTDKKELYEKQKRTLDTFLETGAITKAQYEKSLTVLKKELLGNGEDKIE